MKVHIRKAQTTDAGAIARILKDFGELAYANVTPLDELEASVARHLEVCIAGERHSAYVATGESGQVIGYGTVHWMPTLFQPGMEGYVSELFVLGATRGQGAGKAILAAIVEEGKELNCSRLLVLNNRERESYERGFYGKCGWVERGEMANFVFNY